MQPRPLDLQEYYRLGVIAQNTNQALTRFMSDPDAPAADQPAILGAALDHLALAREGFQLQLKSSVISSLAEMQYLVERALVDWRGLEKLGWRFELPTNIDIPQSQLMAFAHAYLSLAMLPRLPKAQITFPQARQSYADIPVPSSGAEMLHRLEELERVIYRVLGSAPVGVEHESLRRTYGFFESSAWLVAVHRRKFRNIQ